MASSVVSRFTYIFRKHLFLANIGVSITLSGIGDVLQQQYERRHRSGGHFFGGAVQCSSNSVVHKWNLSRTLQMSASFGFTSGLMCHVWYNLLDRLLPGSGLRIVCRKIVIDQLVFSPVCIAICLSVANVIEGQRSPKKIVSEVLDKGLQLYAAEWLIWPPAQFINFYFLPTRLRVLYDNIISLGYDVYTSHVKYSGGGVNAAHEQRTKQVEK